MLLGERGAGMGGAFTAIADDGSALFYNPAGFASIRRQGLSLSANTYGYFSSTEEAAYRDADSQVDITRDGAIIVPNSVVYMIPLGEPGGLQHTLAIGVLVPYAFSWEGAQDLSLEEARADDFDREDSYDAIEESVYLAGPAYAVKIGDLQIGASMFFAWYSQQTSEELTTTFGFGDSVEKEQVFTATSAQYLGLTGDLGALWRPSKAWSVGLKVGLPVHRLWSAAKVRHHASFTAVEFEDEDGEPLDQPKVVDAFQDIYRDVEGEVTWKRPLHFSLGGAWRSAGGVVISADLRLYLPVDPFDLISGETQRASPIPGDIHDPDGGVERSFDSSIQDEGRRQVINGALGAALPLAKSMRLLTGVFTDFSNITDAGVEAGEARVDQYGVSLAIQTVQKAGSLTVGLTGLYGAGKGLGIDLTEGAGDYQSEITNWSVTLFLAGSAPLGEDEDFAEAVEQ